MIDKENTSAPKPTSGPPTEDNPLWTLRDYKLVRTRLEESAQVGETNWLMFISVFLGILVATSKISKTLCILVLSYTFFRFMWVKLSIWIWNKMNGDFIKVNSAGEIIETNLKTKKDMDEEWKKHPVHRSIHRHLCKALTVADIIIYIFTICIILFFISP
jgi:hypothetical protein